MTTRKHIARTDQIDKRKAEMKQFFEAILDPYEYPLLITDEATLFDITLEDEDELIKRINLFYGVSVNERFFSLAFWMLLDFLNKNEP